MRDYSVSFECKQVSLDSSPPKCTITAFTHSYTYDLWPWKPLQQVPLTWSVSLKSDR